MREGFYETHGVKVLVGERAITINRQEKVIHSSAGRTVFYDKLIMATGSYPWIPPIKGSETQDCFVYRTIEDLNAIESCARRSRRGAVVGGGLLGLAAGVLGILTAVLVTLGATTFAVLLGGIVMLPYGVFHMFSHPLDGLMASGTGLILLGAGALCLALSVLFYGRFIPFIIRSIVNGLSRLLHRGR